MIGSKIRVLYFVDRFLQGGIQTLLWNIATSIDRDSFEIEFLCLDDGKTYPMEQDLADMGFKVTKLDGIWLDSPVSFLRYRKALDAFFRSSGHFDIVRGCGQKVGPRGGPDWRFACTAGRRSSSSSWRRRTAWGRPPPRSSRGSRWARPRSGRRGTSRTATPGRAVESGRGNRHGRRPAWAPTSRSTPRPRPARSPGSTRTR